MKLEAYTSGQISFGKKMEKLFEEMELLAVICPAGRCQYLYMQQRKIYSIIVILFVYGFKDN